jgi:PAS domain S-box-containing protein
MRVLVVDDGRDVAPAVRRTLEGASWEVVSARSGSTALELFAASSFELVVMDLDLPDMAGLDLLPRLREISPDVSIVVLTRESGRSRGIAALLAGADNFLGRPFAGDELLARVAVIVRRRARGLRASTRLQQIVTGVTSEVAEAVIITDPGFCIQSFNRAAEELYGWRASEVLQRPVAEVLRWDGSDADRHDARTKLATDGSWRGTASQYRRDGTTVTVYASTRVLLDEEGATLGIIFVNRLSERVGDNSRRRATEATAAAEAEIRDGLAAGEFTVHYQPIFRLEDRMLVGVEALARWEHGDRLRLPHTFIGVAEDGDLIFEIGDVVLDSACRQMQVWRDAGYGHYLTVNVSALQLLDPRFLPRLETILAATEMTPGGLTLEVTETALITDVKVANATLLRIADLGVGVSIDDFGTGWASLSYLQQLPVTTLKIDQSFVAGLGESGTETAIVRSILALGRELDLHVVAEGIETQAQLEQLRLLGCEYGQGYHVSRPLPASELVFASVR